MRTDIFRWDEREVCEVFGGSIQKSTYLQFYEPSSYGTQFFPEKVIGYKKSKITSSYQARSRSLFTGVVAASKKKVVPEEVCWFFSIVHGFELHFEIHDQIRLIVRKNTQIFIYDLLLVHYMNMMTLI